MIGYRISTGQSHGQLYCRYLVILVLNVRLSSSRFPLLLPQPQKSLHPLPLLSLPPFLLPLSIHLASLSLSLSLAYRKSKSESVFTQRQFPWVSLTRVCQHVGVFVWTTGPSRVFTRTHIHGSRLTSVYFFGGELVSLRVIKFLKR